MEDAFVVLALPNIPLSVLFIVLLKPRAMPSDTSFISFPDPKAKFVFTVCTSCVLVKLLLDPITHELPDLTTLLKPAVTIFPPTFSILIPTLFPSPVAQTWPPATILFAILRTCFLLHYYLHQRRQKNYLKQYYFHPKLN